MNFFERVVVGNHWFTAIKNSRSDLIFVTLSWYLQSANNLFVFYLKDKKPHCLLLVTFKCIFLIFVEQLFYLIWKIISKVQGFWVRVSFFTGQDKTRLEDTFRIAKTMTRLLMSSPVARENSRIIPQLVKSTRITGLATCIFWCFKYCTQCPNQDQNWSLINVGPRISRG